jgi:hypothetical protein
MSAPNNSAVIKGMNENSKRIFNYLSFAEKVRVSGVAKLYKKMAIKHCKAYFNVNFCK